MLCLTGGLHVACAHRQGKQGPGQSLEVVAACVVHGTMRRTPMGSSRVFSGEAVRRCTWLSSKVRPCRGSGLAHASLLSCRCAAVLFLDGRCYYTDGLPSQTVLAKLMARRDSQIMALEAIAIALGLSTFAADLRGRKVVLYSDNTGAEVRYPLLEWRYGRHGTLLQGSCPKGHR